MRYGLGSFWIHLDCTRVEIIVPFDSNNFAVCSRRNRVEVTKFSTRGGGISQSSLPESSNTAGACIHDEIFRRFLPWVNLISSLDGDFKHRFLYTGIFVEKRSGMLCREPSTRIERAKERLCKLLSLPFSSTFFDPPVNPSICIDGAAASAIAWPGYVYLALDTFTSMLVTAIVKI
jgi:hypothetical protein